jgi:ectoine hydroxylase-related dioxygenase (phytanoyl-CoA dioxygenase family)
LHDEGEGAEGGWSQPKLTARPKARPDAHHSGCNFVKRVTSMTQRESPIEDRAATGGLLIDPGNGLDEAQRSRLDEAGFLVLEDLMSVEWLDALRDRVAELYDREADRAGMEFKQEPGCRRLANLVDKGPVFERVIAQPQVLACVGHVLGPRFKLSSLNARTALPGCEKQPLHADMGAIRDEQGYWVCNSVWMLDDFTPDNGPLRVVPGSHRSGRLPQDVMVDSSGSHPDEVQVTGRTGTVVVMNAHLWHGGQANRASTPRTALHAFYCRWDKPQQQYQKGLLRAEVQERLAPGLRRLLALDDPLNDELAGYCGPRSGFLV